MPSVDQSFIRNFSIIAHIDHGKTTLTDQLLRVTGTVSLQNLTDRIMDSNPIEQEKGVTIKLAPVRMNYHGYQLNLIDTPGHVDFGYEVSRSLQACEGALLVVDATQGVQAQTLANYEKARQLNLKIIPVVNKIDLPTAQREQTVLEMIEYFQISEADIIFCSAKTGEGVTQILQAIIDRLPAPTGRLDQPLRSLIFTSKYDNHQGAIAYVRVVDGQLTANQDLQLLFAQTRFKPAEIGIFTPSNQPIAQLRAGEVGYLATGLKNIELLKIGDTIVNYQDRKTIQALPGFKEPTPMVYLELYPIDNGEYFQLHEAMDKLKLHDSALQYTPTHSPALGNGLRVGFLGIFHAEIVRERLSREFKLDLIATAPTVKYQIETRSGKKITISNPAELPDPQQINQIFEPITFTTIFSPEQYLSAIIKFCRDKRGIMLNSVTNGSRVKLDYQIPLSELITDFQDRLKSITSGFASLEYRLSDYQPVAAVKVDILINHEAIDALSFISLDQLAEKRGRLLVDRLKDVIPRQLFEIPIQATIGGKIIARQTVKAWRKDVTAKLYGGDITRRMKLLKKQTEGKKRMKQFGKVELNQEAFLAVLKTD